jgi:GNAT superfamily N-acetyltransferase
MLFRSYTPDDESALWRLLEPTIREGETFALPRDMDRDAAVAYWAAPDRHCFLAERDGEILGSFYIRANQLGGGAHVANGGYVTLPAARGQGVARAMCLRSLELAAELGFRAMQFNFVVSSNAPAMKLWQDCGFAIVGRLSEAFLHPRLGYVDAVVMARTL